MPVLTGHKTVQALILKYSDELAGPICYTMRLNDGASVATRAMK